MFGSVWPGLAELKAAGLLFPQSPQPSDVTHHLYAFDPRQGLLPGACPCQGAGPKFCFGHGASLFLFFCHLALDMCEIAIQAQNSWLIKT